MPAADPSTRFPFTEARIRAWPVQSTGRVRLKDASCPGLACYITAGGRVFYFYGKAAGRPVEIRLGAWPTLSVEEARKVARVRIAPDPAGVAKSWRAMKAESTLTELWTWFDRHHIAHLRVTTARRYRDSWRLHIEPELGSRRLSAIGKSDVQRVVDAVADDHGKGAGRHLCAVLSAMYHAAAKDEALAYKGSIPTQGLRRPKVPSRARFLQPGELPRFLAALAEEPELWRVFWTCCLFIGLRRGNVASAEWSHITMETAHWNVSEERSKTGAFLTIPIPLAPLKVLREWRKSHRKLMAEVNDRRGRLLDRGDAVARDRLPLLTDAEIASARRFVFPTVLAGDRPSMHLHVTDPKASWRRILVKAELTDLRPHDLRRSIASWMAIGGVGMNVIGSALGHKDARATAIYARLNDGAVRAAMERATTAMLADVPIPGESE